MSTPDGQSLQIATAERVAVELPIAGLGSRAMAYLVDVALMGAVALVVYFVVTLAIPDPVNAVLGLSGLVRIIGGALLVFGLWVFWTGFELAWNGQSPGKRLVRIRVVHTDGSPVTVFSSAVRNLLRLVDFLPACYPVGVICMLVDRKHRRLGDLLAGTLLVRDEKIDLTAYDAVQTSGLSVDVLELGVQFVKRYPELQPPHRDRVGRQLATKLGLTDVERLEGDALLTAIRARLEQR